jgi:hypothetical protein
MRRGRAACAGACLAIALALPARALVVDGDEEAARREPATGGPVAAVGKIRGLSGVYLGQGWVITAGHVGAGDFGLEGASYPPVPESWRQLHSDGATPADVGLFRVEPAPKLPPLEIARRGPGLGEALLLVACGLGRGERFEWEGRVGFHWDPLAVRRWGRNRVATTGIEVPGAGASTHAFATLFSTGEPQEAQAAVGDSGGGAFVLRRGSWRLAGILFSIAGHPGQPPQTAVDGNATHLVDLSRYLEQIEAVTGLRGEPGRGSR